SSRTASTRALVDEVVRCATFEGQRYCLGSGWTDHTQAQVRHHLVASLGRQASTRTATTTTGDLSAYAALQRRARMTPSARAGVERAELTEAARSVAKVWLLRHQIQRVPFPPGFRARHPELRPAAVATSSAKGSAPQASGRQRAKHWKDY